MEPLISIIVPTYNRCHLLGETLESIINQTYRTWECIVVDDGSEDYTDELLEFYCNTETRIKYFHRPYSRNKGANACRNFGYEKSSGSYINWFDSDDVMRKDKLFLQIAALSESDLDLVVCYSFVFEGSIDNVLGFRHEVIYSTNAFEDYVQRKIVWLTQAPLWRRSLLENFEYLFDEELQAAQEWELFCRLLVDIKDFIVINEVLVYIRKHSQSISYKPNYRETEWNYFLARGKLYTNTTVIKNPVVNEYLQNFLINYFRKSVRNQYRKESLKSLKYLLNDKLLSSRAKANAVAGVISFLILNRGHFFIKKVKYSK